MNEDEIRTLLEGLAAGAVQPAAALQRLKSGPFREGNLGFAQVDHHRRLRQGLGEVIFGESKTLEQIRAIAAGAGGGGDERDAVAGLEHARRGEARRAHAARVVLNLEVRAGKFAAV